MCVNLTVGKRTQVTGKNPSVPALGIQQHIFYNENKNCEATIYMHIANIYYICNIQGTLCGSIAVDRIKKFHRILHTGPQKN